MRRKRAALDQREPVLFSLTRNQARGAVLSARPLPRFFREDHMTRLLAGLGLLMLVLGASAPAQAKGCIKGALIGGTAGHFAGHHGVIGALAGCAIGRHEANKRAQPNAPQSSYGQAPGGNQPR
jgi:hypothetical protein